MGKEHHLIFVPGLGDNTKLLTWAVSRFQQDGLKPQVHTTPWAGTERTFRPKLDRLVRKIDDIAANGHKITLVGASAGASAVLNAYSERRDKVDSVVNVCGRLRAGTQVFPSLHLASSRHPAFRESVTLFENENEPTLTDSDRRKVLTIQAAFDESVPKSTTPLESATNIVLPWIEHNIAIYATLLFSRRAINDFIKSLG